MQPDYREGDEVHVRLVISHVCPDGVAIGTYPAKDSGRGWPIKNEDVVNRIPAPRPIKVGDTVTWGTKSMKHRSMKHRLLWISGTQMLIERYGVAVLMARPGDLEVVD